MIFNIYPHKNVLCNHKTTIEFTKDEELTLKGDCILGVKADFDLRELKKIKGKFKVTIKSKNVQDDLIGYAVDSFDSAHEIVIRKTDFVSPRTFGIKANKSSSEIDRNLVNNLKKHPGTVKIEKIKIKALIFDLDDTLAVWKKEARAKANEFLINQVSDKFNVSETSFRDEFYRVAQHYSEKSTEPSHHSRAMWIREALKNLEAVNDDLNYDALVNLERDFWEEVLKHVKLFDGTLEIIKELKKKYKLAIFSDSDGKKEYKVNRIKKLGLDKLFDVIVTSDDTGYTKPHSSNLVLAAKKLGVKLEECAMIGDWPERDHLNTKKLGMTSILLKNGNEKSMKNYNYVDFEIENINDLQNILKEI